MAGGVCPMRTVGVGVRDMATASATPASDRHPRGAEPWLAMAPAGLIGRLAGNFYVGGIPGSVSRITAPVSWSHPCRPTARSQIEAHTYRSIPKSGHLG